MNKKCATVQAGGVLTLTPCPAAGATVPPSQSFKGSADGRVIAGNGQCLTTAGGAPSPAGPPSANVWGRKLSDGCGSFDFDIILGRFSRGPRPYAHQPHHYWYTRRVVNPTPSPTASPTPAINPTAHMYPNLVPLLSGR